MNYFLLTVVLPLGRNLTVTCSVFIRALCLCPLSCCPSAALLRVCQPCAHPSAPRAPKSISTQTKGLSGVLILHSPLLNSVCWHSTWGVKQPAFSFPTFSRGNDNPSDLLLLNYILMKCYCCTPLCKEHMWLQVINYSLEETNKRFSCLKYFMATINFFSLIIIIAME